MHNVVFAAVVALAFAAPARAGTVFSDDLDSENGGASAFNYTGFANFTVTGAVDIIANGSFFNCPGAGSCVDLAGTPGPGEMRSVASFSFNAGDTVRLTFDLSGNQRGNSDPGPDEYHAGFSFAATTLMINYGFNYFGNDVIVFPGIQTDGVSTSSAIGAGAPFAARSVFFTAGNAGSLQFFIGSASADDFGPVLDNVSLDITAVPEPASWAMMIAGFGLAGIAMRRRRPAHVLA